MPRERVGVERLRGDHRLAMRPSAPNNPRFARSTPRPDRALAHRTSSRASAPRHRAASSRPGRRDRHRAAGDARTIASDARIAEQRRAIAARAPSARAMQRTSPSAAAALSSRSAAAGRQFGACGDRVGVKRPAASICGSSSLNARGEHLRIGEARNQIEQPSACARAIGRVSGIRAAQVWKRGDAIRRLRQPNRRSASVGGGAASVDPPMCQKIWTAPTPARDSRSKGEPSAIWRRARSSSVRASAGWSRPRCSPRAAAGDRDRSARPRPAARCARAVDGVDRRRPDGADDALGVRRGVRGVRAPISPTAVPLRPRGDARAPRLGSRRAPRPPRRSRAFGGRDRRHSRARPRRGASARFLAEAKRVHDALDRPFLRAARADADGPRMAAAARTARARRADAHPPLRLAMAALGGYFRDPRLRQLFGRYATYRGSSPFAAPATLMLIAHVEAAGVWLVEGGMHRLALALERWRGAGGGVSLRCARCDEIMVERGRARGCACSRAASGSAPTRSSATVTRGARARAARPGGARAPCPPLPRRSAIAVGAGLDADGRRPRGFPLGRHNVFFSRRLSGASSRDLAAGRVPPGPDASMSARRTAMRRTVRLRTGGNGADHRQCPGHGRHAPDDGAKRSNDASTGRSSDWRRAG